MQFHLNHSPRKFDFELNHRDSAFFTGSCFAENIAAYLEEHRFSILRNPYGILFNPKSIFSALKNIFAQKETEEQLILERGGSFVHYFGHSSLKAASKKDLIEDLQKQQSQALEFIRNAKCMVITFGSAFVYQHKKLNTIVGNCHKQPQKEFKKYMLFPDEIVEDYLQIIADLHTLNSKLQIIFTVSPVKYLRDGLENNALSKASLLLAVHKLVKAFPFCHYFPAYELMNDDLRDYRFYKEDLAHPNAQAVEYIWEKFSHCAFSEKTRQLNAEIEKLNAALLHRPLGSKTDPKFEEFIEAQKRRIQGLEL